MILVLILIVMICDLLIPFIIAIPYKGYKHTQTVMSVLGRKASPLGWLYNIWMVVSGCVITLFGYQIFQHYYEYQHGLAVMLLISFILYGIGDEVISGFFPLNEKKENVTLSSKIQKYNIFFNRFVAKNDMCTIICSIYYLDYRRIIAI